jgi:hypothetical protein
MEMEPIDSLLIGLLQLLVFLHICVWFVFIVCDVEPPCGSPPLPMESPPPPCLYESIPVGEEDDEGENEEEDKDFQVLDAYF